MRRIGAILLTSSLLALGPTPGCDDSSPHGDTFCGDDVAEVAEACDGPDLGGATCESLGHLPGTLACAADCTFDVSGCVGGGPVCGNGAVEGTEDCDDGNVVNGDGCSSVCAWEDPNQEDCDDDIDNDGDGDTDCDDDECTTHPACVGDDCGNDQREGSEVCDGADLDGQSCTTIGQGFTGGDLACNGACTGWDTTGCTGAPVAWTVQSTEMRLQMAFDSLIAAHPTDANTISVLVDADEFFTFFEVWRTSNGTTFGQTIIWSFTASMGFWGMPLAVAYDPNDGTRVVASIWPTPPETTDQAVIHAWSTDGGGFYDVSYSSFTNPWPPDDMRFVGGQSSYVVWRASSYFYYSTTGGEYNDFSHHLSPLPTGCDSVSGFDVPWDNHLGLGVWCYNGVGAVCASASGPCTILNIPGGGAVKHLAFAPSDPDQMYILADGPSGEALFVSTDRGVTVTEVHLMDANVIKVNPNNALQACALRWTSGRELHCTTDGGTSWADLTPPDLAGPAMTLITDFTFAADGALWATAHPGVIRHPPL